MSHLISNIPLVLKAWVRKEFTHNHRAYHGEFLHCYVIAVNTIPDRCLSFQVIFTGCEDEENRLENPHGGAMWARMPITALVEDEPLDEMPPPMPTHIAQPWDVSSREHSIIIFDRTSSSPWLARIEGEFYTAKYYFTVDYTNSEIADDPAQHKQSHVLALTEWPWKGCFVALPNNRVRVTSPAMWVTGNGPPDFVPSQWTHKAEAHDSYMDWEYTFNNLYAPDNKKKK